MELEIKVYGLLSCPHCKEAREFLKERGVEFETVFVDLLTGDEKSEALKELRHLNPACSFPTTVIGEKVIVGFKKDEIATAIGENP